MNRKMNGIIIYKSKYGATKKYAEWIAERTGFACMKTDEADVKKLQAENGLTLSNMALAQVCGLPLSTRFKLDEHELEETYLPSDAPNTEAAVSNRSEMQLMQEAEKIAKSTAMIAAAGLQPNIVAQANYLYSNPNAENGIKNDWKGKGWFSAGVVVNVPIVHADDILRYKAAKHAAKAVALKTEETRELLTLQTTQANQKMMEAQQKIALARLTENNAAEVLRMAQEAKTTETQLRKYFGSLK